MFGPSDWSEHNLRGETDFEWEAKFVLSRKTFEQLFQTVGKDPLSTVLKKNYRFFLGLNSKIIIISLKLFVQSFQKYAALSELSFYLQ